MPMGCQHHDPYHAGASGGPGDTAGATSFTVAMPRLTFGRGVLAELGARAAWRGFRRAALFTDPHLVDGPLVATAVASLKAAGLDVATFDEIRVEPDDASAERGARFVADSAWVKIVRLWSVTSRTEKNRRILATTERIAEAGRLNEKATAARERMARQMETDQLVVKRLAQEYESALLATVAVPGVDAGVVEAIDTETFTQSPEQIALATAALKLLAGHIEALSNGERIDVRRALAEAYPLPR